MSKWVYRLEVKDLWKQYDNDELTVPELGKLVAERIRKSPCYDKEIDTLEELVNEFECYCENEEGFDNILDRLYDWADEPLPTPEGEMQRKMCWVATRF